MRVYLQLLERMINKYAYGGYASFPEIRLTNTRYKWSFSALTTKTEVRDEGANLNVYQAIYGKIAQVRAANNLKSTIPSGEERQIYQLTITPVYPIYRRYTIGDNIGFVLRISAEGILTIQPFGSAMSSGDPVNFSETFFIK